VFDLTRAGGVRLAAAVLPHAATGGAWTNLVAGADVLLADGVLLLGRWIRLLSLARGSTPTACRPPRRLSHGAGGADAYLAECFDETV
jgi:hypothetical protein